MSEADVRQVIEGIDAALNVFRRNEGRLTVSQIRARSMLSVVRSEVAEGLSQTFRQRARGAELFVDGHVLPPPLPPQTERSA